MMLKMNN